MGMKTKYGVAPYSTVKPIESPEGLFYASQVLSKLSGRYVVYGTSSTYFLACADNAAAASGYVTWTGTTSSTNGGTKLAIAMNIDQFATELPYAASGAAATLTNAVLVTLYSKLIDMYVTSNIQYADNNASQSAFRIVGGDAAENTLYITVLNSKLNQAAL